MVRTIYEVALRAPVAADEEAGIKGDPGRVVGFQEMGTEQLLRAFSMSGQQPGGEQATNYATKLHALRLCVVEDEGKPVTYAELTGPLWDNRFSLRETSLLMLAWGQIHEPNQGEVDGLGGMTQRAKSGG